MLKLSEDWALANKNDKALFNHFKDITIQAYVHLPCLGDGLKVGYNCWTFRGYYHTNSASCLKCHEWAPEEVINKVEFINAGKRT